MKNREWLRGQSEYDLLLTMQSNLESHRANDEPVCITAAIDNILDMRRCEFFNGECDRCVQFWLNEERR